MSSKAFSKDCLTSYNTSLQSTPYVRTVALISALWQLLMFEY